MITRYQYSILIAFFLLLNSSSIYSQYNSVFGDEYTEWNYAIMYCDATFMANYAEESDTLIENVEYKIFSNLGLLRESEGNTQLWFRKSDTGEEHLIMDLDLNVGDFFQLNMIEYQVDSVYLDDGRKVVQFDYTPESCGIDEPLRFIEGLGPNLGFLFIMTDDIEDRMLNVCHTKDSNTEYYLFDYFGEVCLLDDTSTDDMEEYTIHIYPNPFEERVVLEFEEHGNRTIEILDVLGRKVMNKSINESTIEINTQGLESGSYILKVTDGSLQRSSIIIKR